MAESVKASTMEWGGMGVKLFGYVQGDTHISLSEEQPNTAESQAH